jgi:hypothetical protein
VPAKNLIDRSGWQVYRDIKRSRELLMGNGSSIVTPSYPRTRWAIRDVARATHSETMLSGYFPGFGTINGHFGM